MTRPIYEPTEQRQMAALGYDKNQLQRRPAPLESPTIFIWGRAVGSGDVIPDDGSATTLIDLTVREVAADQNYIEPYDDGGLTGLQINHEGQWALSLHISWTAEFVGDRYIHLDMNNSEDFDLFSPKITTGGRDFITAPVYRINDVPVVLSARALQSGSGTSQIIGTATIRAGFWGDT